MHYYPTQFYTAYSDYIASQPPKRHSQMLWVSDLGFHPYNALNRILNQYKEDFPPDTLSKMEDGNMMEEHSVNIWSRSLPYTTHTDVPLYNNLWSGEADAIFDLHSAHPIILEHKTTTLDGWRRGKELGPVKIFHACQAWLYGQLFFDRYAIQPTIILYYRSMANHWAELELTTTANNCLQLTGHIRGQPITLYSETNPHHLRTELEYFYARQELPPAPEAPNWDYAGTFTLG